MLIEALFEVVKNPRKADIRHQVKRRMWRKANSCIHFFLFFWTLYTFIFVRRVTICQLISVSQCMLLNSQMSHSCFAGLTCVIFMSMSVSGWIFESLPSCHAVMTATMFASWVVWSLTPPAHALGTGSLWAPWQLWWEFHDPFSVQLTILNMGSL